MSALFKNSPRKPPHVTERGEACREAEKISLAEPTGFAATTMIRKTIKAEFSPSGILCRPCELCRLERSRREEKAVVSRRGAEDSEKTPFK